MKIIVKTNKKLLEIGMDGKKAICVMIGRSRFTLRNRKKGQSLELLGLLNDVGLWLVSQCVCGFSWNARMASGGKSMSPLRVGERQNFSQFKFGERNLILKSSFSFHTLVTAPEMTKCCLGDVLSSSSSSVSDPLRTRSLDGLCLWVFTRMFPTRSARSSRHKRKLVK